MATAAVIPISAHKAHRTQRKHADLDLKAGSIKIRRLKASMLPVQPVYQHRGQPLLDEQAAVRAWLRKRVEDGSDYLFTSQKGGKLSRIQFFRNFQRVAEIAGLAPEKCHPHVLKHSLASHLVAGNALRYLKGSST